MGSYFAFHGRKTDLHSHISNIKQRITEWNKGKPKEQHLPNQFEVKEISDGHFHIHPTGLAENNKAVNKDNSLHETLEPIMKRQAISLDFLPADISKKIKRSADAGKSIEYSFDIARSKIVPISKGDRNTVVKVIRGKGSSVFMLLPEVTDAELISLARGSQAVLFMPTNLAYSVIREKENYAHLDGIKFFYATHNLEGKRHLSGKLAWKYRNSRRTLLERMFEYYASLGKPIVVPRLTIDRLKNPDALLREIDYAAKSAGLKVRELTAEDKSKMNLVKDDFLIIEK